MLSQDCYWSETQRFTLSNARLWRRVVARIAFSSSFLYTRSATSRHVRRLRFPSSSSITSMYRQRRHSCSLRSSKDKTAFWIASISARLASSCSDISSSYVIRFTMVLPIGSPAPGLRLEPSFSRISGNWALLFSLVIRSRWFSVCIHVEYLLLMVFMYFLHIIQVTLIFQLFARNFCVISSI